VWDACSDDVQGDVDVAAISLTDEGAALQERAVDVPRCIVESMGVGLGEVIGLRDRLKELTASIEHGSVERGSAASG
jgi:hypothetical protein